jgi:hypothetical protein
VRGRESGQAQGCQGGSEARVCWTRGRFLPPRPPTSVDLQVDAWPEPGRRVPFPEALFSAVLAQGNEEAEGRSWGGREVVVGVVEGGDNGVVGKSAACTVRQDQFAQRDKAVLSALLLGRLAAGDDRNKSLRLVPSWLMERRSGQPHLASYFSRPTPFGT